MDSRSILIASAIVMASFPTMAQTMRIGTNDFPLVFEDTSLSETNKTLLAFELTEAFAFGKTPSDIFETRFDGEDEFGQIVDPHQSCTYAFTSLEELFFQKDNDIVSCHVPVEVSCDFTNRLETFKDYSAAIQGLREKIQTVNSAVFTNLSLQEKVDCFWPAITVPDNVTQEQVNHFETQIVPLIRNYTIYPPSIFRLHPELTIRGDTALLWAYCHVTPKPGVEGSDTTVPVGYVGGKWRFFFSEY